MRNESKENIPSGIAEILQEIYSHVPKQYEWTYVPVS